MTALVPQEKSGVGNTDPIRLPFESRDVRIVMRDGEPWFVLSDLCRALAVVNVSQVAARLDEDEQHMLNIGSSRGGRPNILVSEPGLFKVVARSSSATTTGTVAHRFLRWLTHEVLPSIRKHGSYPPPAIIADPEPEFIPATRAGRFLAEVKRFEEATGYDFADAANIHREKMRHIELSRDGIAPILSRKDMWVRLISLGLDLRFILFGQRETGQSQFPASPKQDRLNLLA